MDAQELRNLQESYNQVYQELDELTSADIFNIKSRDIYAKKLASNANKKSNPKKK